MLLSFYYAIKRTPAKPPQTLSALLQAKDRKRKRPQDFEDPLICALAKRLQKRSRTSVADTIGWEAASADTKSKINPIKYRIQKESWPEKYFEQGERHELSSCREEISIKFWR
jgi:hypothetical protein